MRWLHKNLAAKGRFRSQQCQSTAISWGPSVCQIKTCRILTLVKTTAQQGAEEAPQLALDTCFFSPRNPKFSSLLLRTHPKHPLHPGGKVNSRKPFLGTVTSNATMNGTLRSLHLLFPFPPPPPFLSSLSLRLKPTNLNSPQILICSSLPATHYLLCCLVNSKY